jgi:hypothetical protein
MVKEFFIWVKTQIDWVKSFFQQADNKGSMSSISLGVSR